MKRILTAALCLALCPLLGVAEEPVYYVNPDGGQFYHTQAQCPSMSESYWDHLSSMTPADLAQTAYEPCSVCAAPPVERVQANPWLSAFDTASDILIDAAGTYQAGADLNAGLYTVVTDTSCDGAIVISFSDGTTHHEFPIRGESSYSFYLGDGMSIALPAHAVLTPIIKRNEFPSEPETETIRQGRRMLIYEMQPFVYTAEAIEGEEAFVVFTSILAETGQGSPQIIPLPAGETVIFDTHMNGVNDPTPIRYFSYPDGDAYFIEFINCVVCPVDMSNG